MTSVKKIGVISKTNGTVAFEWEIHNFFSYTDENVQYRSPDLQALNSTWQIAVWINGRTCHNSVGYISLYVYRIDNGPKTVDFSFGIKTKDQLIVNKYETSWKSSDKDKGFGWHKFIQKSKLQQEEDNLVPSGNLTIIWSVICKDDEQEFNMNETKNVLAADLKKMLTSKKSTDVIIKVQEGTFSAHRFILAARSPVLAAMFENEMIEKKTGFIDISDCDPKAFGQFLLYLYSGEIDAEKCNFFRLYKIGDKYDVPQIKLMCIHFIIRNISLENFCETYLFGHQFNERKLLTVAQNFFNGNFEKVVSLDSWESMMEEEAHLANNLLKTIASKVKIEE